MSFPAAEGWRELPDDTFVGLLGPLYQREGGEGVELGMIAGERLRNLSGVVHGGAIMTLLDRASGLAVRAVSEGRVATASMTVNFLRALPVGTPLVVRARIRRAGRTSFFTEAEAMAGNTPVATASGVFLRVAKGP